MYPSDSTVNSISPGIELRQGEKSLGGIENLSRIGAAVVIVAGASPELDREHGHGLSALAVANSAAEHTPADQLEPNSSVHFHLGMIVVGPLDPGRAVEAQSHAGGRHVRQ
jgi:hypothetical protein